MWHFASMRPSFVERRRRTCYPSPALNATGHQHGTQPQGWPDAGDNCVDPGPPGKGRPFPTYWNVKRCGEDEVRVVYSLYFQHDGFSNVLVARGHSASPLPSRSSPSLDTMLTGRNGGGKKCTTGNASS